MAADVDLKYDLIGGSVKRLLKLHDVVEQMQRTVGALRDRQTSDVWPKVQGLDAFAAKYRRAISISENDLSRVRQELGEASQALAATLRAHQARDEAESERMRAFIAALDSATTTPLPDSTRNAPAAARQIGSIK